MQPLLQTIRSTAWGAHYVQVLAQVVQSPRVVQSESIDRVQLSGLLRVRALLQAALAHVPPPVLDERIVWANDNVVLALARWSRAAAHNGPIRAAAQGLIDYCVAGLGAPVSHKLSAGDSPALRESIGYFFG